MRRTDTLWRSLGTAAVLHQAGADLPLVLLTTEAPAPGSTGAAALNVVKGAGRPVLDVVELLNTQDQERLREYAHRGQPEL